MFRQPYQTCRKVWTSRPEGAVVPPLWPGNAMHELQKAAQAVAQLADAMTVILARGIDGHPGHPKE